MQFRVVKENEPILSLEMIRLGHEVAKVQERQLQKVKMDRLDIQLLNLMKSALNRQSDSQREKTTLLKEALSWSEEDREKSLIEWQENQMNDEDASPAFVEKRGNDPLKKVYAQPAKPNNLMSYPPEPVCNMERPEGQTNDWIVRTKPQFLFSHTDKKLENHFPLRDFITGYGNMASYPGGIKIFNLDILVVSPKAGQIFGDISQKDFIVLGLLDGTKLSLQNRVNANGYWEAKTQSYIYHGQYLIGAKEERLLLSNEIDKILIKWSKAKEEYEIFELDFFINQLWCLENQ